MTNEQINIAIAKACGYKNVTARMTEGTIRVITGFKHHTFDEEIPDYCTDLNAMHEAENILRNQFTTLEEAYWRNLAYAKPHPIYATAAQRAEAFLRTINKWED